MYVRNETAQTGKGEDGLERAGKKQSVEKRGSIPLTCSCCCTGERINLNFFVLMVVISQGISNSSRISITDENQPTITPA